MTITDTAADFVDLQEEDKALLLQQMHQCLDFSYQIFRLVEKSTSPEVTAEVKAAGVPDDFVASMVNVDELLAIIPPVDADERQILLMRLFDITGTMGVCSCAIHKYSHALHHILFDPALKEAIAQRDEAEEA